MKRACSVVFLILAYTLAPLDGAHGAELQSVAPGVVAQDAAGRLAKIIDPEAPLTYVDFWASWCPPCQQSLPWMNTLVDRFGAKGLSVVAVSVDRERASAERSLKRVQPRFRVLFDSQGKAASSYAVPTMPTSYLIDRNGRIRRVLRGFRSSDKASLEADIERLLNEQ